VIRTSGIRRLQLLTHRKWPRERSVKGDLHGQGLQKQEAEAERVWCAQHARGENKLGGRPNGRPHMKSSRLHGRPIGTSRELQLFSGKGHLY